MGNIINKTSSIALRLLASYLSTLGDDAAADYIQYGPKFIGLSRDGVQFYFTWADNGLSSWQNENDMLLRGCSICFGDGGTASQAIYAQFMAISKSLIINGGNAWVFQPNQAQFNNLITRREDFFYQGCNFPEKCYIIAY